MDEYIGVIFHHGGYFIDEKYVGEGEEIGHVVDKDHFSLPELVSYIKETPEMRYNSVGGLFVLFPKTQKFFPNENDYQLLNLIKDLKDGDRFDVCVSHAIDNLEVVEEDVVVGYLPSSQVGDSDQATEIRGGLGASVDVGEGADLKVDEGIGVNCNEGIGVTTDEGNGVNTDDGIGVNCEEGIGVNADEDIEVNTSQFMSCKRRKSVITMLEEIRHKMMSRKVDMIKFVETWASDISPMARLVLEENKEIGRKLKVQWNADTGFEVNEGMYRHTVDIQKREYSCRLWRLRGIPCQHAICAFNKIGKEAEDYVEH
ncbi:hypothetical protein A4A49_14730 [Nicotiana attenuata]|uniref:SWIM-type domain-containing protein n=1 Tax=Nicotiana attenuata TaxID=49451 RepID=A0A314LG86_NICAT|nr:hypothetical protein A4A49_14730 [Nicotiana attenuata]